MEQGQKHIKLFLSGDVMTGRGIDQILPHPNEPMLYESYVKDARKYVELGELRSGTINRLVNHTYIWGDALDEWRRHSPDIKIINLETSITSNESPNPEKGIHYKMHPGNIGCLTAADIDCCVLANNHVLDWNEKGLLDTIENLKKNGISFTGAGTDINKARSPAIFEITGKGRVVVFSYATPDCGVKSSWKAEYDKPGINYLTDLSKASLDVVCDWISSQTTPQDIVVVSIHWGGNWGYDISSEQKSFSRGLVDRAGVNVIHGHSSHHPKGFDLYKNHPIFYGCGDFINDYEGIGGREEFKSHLSLMYFVVMNPDSGELVTLDIVPMEIKKFRLQSADKKDSAWLKEMFTRENNAPDTKLIASNNALKFVTRKGQGVRFRPGGEA